MPTSPGPETIRLLPILAATVAPHVVAQFMLQHAKESPTLDCRNPVYPEWSDAPSVDGNAKTSA